MTRKELLAAARAEGAHVQWYQVSNAIACGRMPEPRLIHARCYDYTQEHLRRVVELFGGRQLEATR